MNARRGMAALAMALAVGACSQGEDRAGSLPQITTTPTASPAPTSSVPPFPATKQGAAQSVHVFFAQGWNPAAATGDLKLLRAMSDPSCVSCQALLGYFERVWSDGGSLRGGQVKILAVETALADEAAATVTSLVDVEAAEQLDRSGRVVKRVPPDSGFSATIQLRRVGEGWIVTSWTRDGK